MFSTSSWHCKQTSSAKSIGTWIIYKFTWFVDKTYFSEQFKRLPGVTIKVLEVLRGGQLAHNSYHFAVLLQRNQPLTFDFVLNGLRKNGICCREANTFITDEFLSLFFSTLKRLFLLREPLFLLITILRCWITRSHISILNLSSVRVVLFVVSCTKIPVD